MNPEMYAKSMILDEYHDNLVKHRDAVETITASVVSAIGTRQVDTHYVFTIVNNLIKCPDYLDQNGITLHF